jgi:glycosyltransferase involved in cell wall biosynthesis
VPEDELGELLASADVCINPDKYDRMNDISTMNKIMDYMALSKPIVQFDLTEGHVSAGDASLYVKRNDATALAQGIAELLEDESRRKHMGEVGRERLEGGLAWEHQIPNLIAAYAETLAKDNPAKLRVALISPPFEQSGGIGRLMGYLVEAIDDSKIELVVIDSRGGWINPLFSLVTLFRATAALMHLRLTRPPDVVHINLSDGGSTIRKCWLILVSKALGFPTVVHLHAGTYPEFFGSLPALGKGLVRSILRQCDAFLTLGTHWQKFAISELGLVPERVHVVRYGVPGPDPDRFRHRAKLRSAEPLRVVFLGRLGELKGTPQLLQALAVLAERGVEWTATLAGDGDVEATRAAAVRLGINDRVELPGWVTTAKTEELLEGANVLALPSFVEGLPVSVLEGLAHGLAVVTTPVGALLDILVDRENSFLVTPGDVTGLADALELLARDQQFRERLGECARRTWQDQLSMESCAPKLVQAWERAIA